MTLKQHLASILFMSGFRLIQISSHIEPAFKPVYSAIVGAVNGMRNALQEVLDKELTS